MIPRLRTMILAGVLATGGLLASGTNEAKAQFVAATPGFSLSVGNPYGGYGYGGYGGYGYPGAYGYGAPVVAAPVVVAPRPFVYGGGYRPYGYGYGRPGFYGPRYGPYRRW